MKKTSIYCLMATFFIMTCISEASDLASLFHGVETLKIQRNGYVLGGKLNKKQLALAKQNPMDAASEKVFKFRDKKLMVVADQKTNRVIVIYESFNKVSRKKVQNVIGELFLTYEDPTISAHDKVVYWAWGKEGKYTSKQYDMAREKNKKLNIIATVKFNSQIKIMDKKAPESTGNAASELTGDAYYIISSDPLLKYFHDT